MRHGVECNFPRHNEVPAISFGDISSPVTAPELNSAHLELLHNYTVSTSNTLSSDPVLRDLWRINVPRVGFAYDFVMQSILALSALHMSTSSNERRGFYLRMARSEHGKALNKIASALSHVTAENCSAIYISAALTFIYAWASPRQQGDFFLVGSSGVAEWVFLLQGVRSITESWGTALRDGPFSAMFRHGRSRMILTTAENRMSASWLSTAEHAQLAQLRQTIAHASRNYRTAETCLESIEKLEDCFCAIFSTSAPADGYTSTSDSSCSPIDGTPINNDETPSPVALTSDVYSWLYRMDDNFVELLNQRCPLSLVIFAHFCVLLRVLHGCWWMKGWSTHLLQEIWDLLEAEHRNWIRWPIERTGWRPSD